MFTRRETMLGGAALIAAAARPVRAAPARARNLVLVLAAGGWDVTWALDPKPGLPGVDGAPGTLRRFGDSEILVGDDRPAVGAWFERWGALTAVVNGVGVRSIAHPACRHRILTGSGAVDAPDVGAIVAHETGRERPVPYLILGSTAFSGPLAASTGRVGTTNQILALLDPSQDLPPDDGRGLGFVPDAQDEELIGKLLAARAGRERAVRGRSAANVARVQDFLDSLERAAALRGQAERFGQRGITLGLPEQARLAAGALESGLARSVMLDTRLPWDTHTNNAVQSQLHHVFYTGLGQLMDELASRRGSEAGHTLLDETVVVALSEMSRTPRLNLTAGKDHWPYTSGLVIGAGVRGGRTVGGTDDTLTGLPTDLASGAVGSGPTLQAQNLLAGVLALTRVDPATAFPGTEPLRAIVA